MEGGRWRRGQVEGEQVVEGGQVERGQVGGAGGRGGQVGGRWGGRWRRGAGCLQTLAQTNRQESVWKRYRFRVIRCLVN